MTSRFTPDPMASTEMVAEATRPPLPSCTSPRSEPVDVCAWEGGRKTVLERNNMAARNFRNPVDGFVMIRNEPQTFWGETVRTFSLQSGYVPDTQPTNDAT